jgi:flagellar hook-associated protein 2
MLDTSGFGLGLRQITKAQDAVLQIGTADLPGAGILATSGSNEFSSLVDGLHLTIQESSDKPVTITVEESDEKVVSNAKLLVKQYNALHDKIEELTDFDAETGTTGLLFGSHETLQIEMRLSRLLSGRFFGVGSIQSLAELGFGFSDSGELELDESKLEQKFAEDPESVRQFFTEKELGFTAKLNATIEAVAGEDDSLLIGRNATLQRQIEMHAERIEFYNERLAKERERLLQYYNNLELALAKIQSSQPALASLSSAVAFSNNWSSNNQSSGS